MILFQNAIMMALNKQPNGDFKLDKIVRTSSAIILSAGMIHSAEYHDNEQMGYAVTPIIATSENIYVDKNLSTSKNLIIIECSSKAESNIYSSIKEIDMAGAAKTIAELQIFMQQEFTKLEGRLSTIEADIKYIKDDIKEIKKDYAQKKDLTISALSIKNWIFVSILSVFSGTAGAGLVNFIKKLFA